MRTVIVILIIAAIIYLAVKSWPTFVKAMLVRKVTDKFGDMPGIGEKSIEELKEMLTSGGGQ